jgi:hypothetical protein
MGPLVDEEVQIQSASADLWLAAELVPFHPRKWCASTRVTHISRSSNQVPVCRGRSGLHREQNRSRVAAVLGHSARN